MPRRTLAEPTPHEKKRRKRQKVESFYGKI